MSLIHDFAEYFKSRHVPIDRWYEDGVGKWAFRVTIGDDVFVCAAVSRTDVVGGDDVVSAMKRVPGRAQTRDAYVCLRVADERYVFDPIAILAEGTEGKPHDDQRTERGEKWIYFPKSLGVDFEYFVDGHASPPTYADVTKA